MEEGIGRNISALRLEVEEAKGVDFSGWRHFEESLLI